MRVVLDTSVLVAGLRSKKGASFRLLELVWAGEIAPLANVAMFLEYEEVLKRPEQRLAHGFSLAEIDQFLGGLAVAVEHIDRGVRWRPLLRDPADEMFAEAALNGRARTVVTHNVRDFAALSVFRVRVETPAQTLRRLKP